MRETQMNAPRPLHVHGPHGGDEARLAQLSIQTVRTLAMDAVEAAQSGHPGTPMGLAPLGYALFAKVLSYDAARPDWPDRDRFVLSCGHASMLLYALLHLTRGAPTLDEIRRFRQWGSPTAGHPEHGMLPGIETTTGPLGQGFANAVGMALAERVLAARFNRDGHAVVDHRTWVMASDGDLMEGVCQEAASLAGHLALSRLCVFWDDNRITIDGGTDLSFSEDVAGRFAAYGWNVVRVPLDAPWTAYVEAADQARACADKPTLVICRTHIGYGAPTKQDTADAHGAPLGAEEVRRAKQNLGWPEDASFLVPDEVRDHMRRAGLRGAAASKAWDARRAAWAAAHPDLAPELDRVLSGALPPGWAQALPTFPAGGKMATRKASGKVLDAIASLLPELVGGSADLSGSNLTQAKGMEVMAPPAYDGRYVHYGVREHAMGGVMNGLALHGGVRPYGGTFLVFSDYMRPSIRLAALMGLKVVYVFTHDSIGVGEDGPTHQPVEHLAALRSIPGLLVLRPADGEETAASWQLALEADGPVALVLTRQGLPEPPRGAGGCASARAGVAQGAYVLRDAARAPDVVLLASGSEVQHALGAAKILEGEGVAVRVVSFPCWELFARRSEAERQRVLGPTAVRVAVEAACSLGWHRWVGEGGSLVTIDRFGASAPAERIMEELGFTAAHVAEVARAALARARQATRE